MNAPDQLPKIVITNRVHSEIVSLLSQRGTVVANAGDAPWPDEQLRAEAKDATALMVFMPDRIGADFLDACPKLRIVACALKGFDNIDVDACAARGIAVTIVPDLLTAPTAELTVAMMISLARHVTVGDRAVRKGFEGWRPQLYGAGLDGNVVGILGMGAIGRAVARRLAGFGCDILYWDRRRLSSLQEPSYAVSFCAFDELLRQSCFVVVALPLTDETLHLVDAAAIASTPRGAFLINPSRGSVVDEAAVADALERGHLGGYAADVFEMEDWARNDRPRAIDPRLLGMTDRTLFTPHLGSAVARVRRAIEHEAASNIIAALEGRRPRGAMGQPALTQSRTVLEC